MIKKQFIAILISTLSLGSCDWFEEKGCTDSTALNRNFGADKDDGSCKYSTATFYSTLSFIFGIPITKIVITVDGNTIGSIDGGAYYSTMPGNCSAQGTVPYKFSSSKKLDWNATIYLASGDIRFTSGEMAPSSSIDCIKINVIR